MNSINYIHNLLFLNFLNYLFRKSYESLLI